MRIMGLTIKTQIYITKLKDYKTSLLLRPQIIIQIFTAETQLLIFHLLGDPPKTLLRLTKL